MARLSMRCPDEMVAAVDRARGDVPREVWLRKAVVIALSALGHSDSDEWRSVTAAERALSEAKGPTPTEQADPGLVPSPEGVRSAAPAEQPERRVPPSRPISPRVPSPRPDVAPFQRGSK